MELQGIRLFKNKIIFIQMVSGAYFEAQWIKACALGLIRSEFKSISIIY